MDSQNTTMQELAASLKKTKDDIDSLYKKLGTAVLRSEAAKGEEAPQAAADWKRLMQEREEAASSVLAIKDNLKRAQDIGKTGKELAKSLADAKKRARGAGARFASSFWDEYSADRFPSFAPVYEAARAEKEACEELEERQRSVGDGIEEGRTLSKMMAHFRGAGLSAQLYYKKSRFEQAAGAAMEALATDGGAFRLAEELRAAEGLQIPESFAPFSEAASEISSILLHIKSADAERQAVSEALRGQGAAENPSKRLDVLRATIKEKDAAIDNICRARGVDYAGTFFDDKGAPLPGAGDAGADEFGQQLLEFSRLAARRADIEKRIDVLQTEAKIRQLDKAIAGHGAEIDSLNKKIDSMKARVESLEKTIGDISSEKAGLQSYLEKIKGECGGEASPADEGPLEQGADGQAAEDAEIVETSEN